MSDKELLLGNKIFDPSNNCLIIAEVAQAHEGSLGIAHSFIDAAADVGVDAIKFQTHIAEFESTKDEQFRYKFSTQDNTRFDYWRRMEFSLDQWKELYEHAISRNIIFLSSPFSEEAVNLLFKIGVRDWKIGSGESLSMSLVNSIKRYGGTTLISTGMSNWNEIDEIVKIFKGYSMPFGLMQCKSEYPTPLKNVGIELIPKMMSKYNVPIGLSDHSGKISPSIAAICLGASFIEVHVTFDRKLFGPDATSSVNFSELSQIVEFRNDYYLMKKNPIDKDRDAISLKRMRLLFDKSLSLKNSKLAGEIVKREDLILKKPGNGISIKELESIVGRKLKHDVSSIRLLKLSDFENA